MTKRKSKNLEEFLNTHECPWRGSEVINRFAKSIVKATIDAVIPPKKRSPDSEIWQELFVTEGYNKAIEECHKRAKKWLND